MLLLIAVSFLICSTAIGTECTIAKESGFECDEQLPVTHFYFDTRKGVCQPFLYAGCGGNENRFNTSADCRKQCNDETIHSRNQKNTDENLSPITYELICSQTYDSSHELNAASVKHVRRHAYNKDFSVCNRFSYLGKAGNFKNFPNWQSCMEFCAR